MANDFETWRVLEFLLRQPNIPKEILLPILSSLPFPYPLPLPLRKSILIRSVAASPFYPSSLLSIELLHQLRLDSSPPSPLIQPAYCAVAVGSTVAFLESGDLPTFLLAVEVTWQNRFLDAEANEEGRGLISAELWRWGVRLKRAMRSQEMRDELMDCWNVEKGMKLKAVVKFLKAEVEEMGLSTLEIAAAAFLEKKKEKEKEKGEGVVMGNEKTRDFPASQEELDFNEVMGSQKTSVDYLHNVVEGPLPNATIEADRLIASNPVEVMHLEEPKENLNLDSEGNQNRRDDSAPLHSADEDVIFTERTNGIEPNKDAEKVSSHNVMVRNPTDSNYEVICLSDDSASDDSSPPSKKIHLSSPRRSMDSRSKPSPNFKKISRPRRRWSPDEEDALREAVEKYGKGNWAIIVREFSGRFVERTQGDLKDKWRNMSE